MNNNPNFEYYAFLSQKEGKEEPAPTAEQTPAEPIEATEPAAPPIDRAPIRAAAKRAYARVGAALAILTLTWFAVSELLSVAFSYLVHSGICSESIYDSALYSLVMDIVPLYLTALPLYFLVLRSMQKQPPLPRSVSPAHYLAYYTVGCLPLVAGGILGNILMSIFSTAFGYDYAADFNAAFDMPFWLNMLLVVILAPLFEELIFRKLLIDRLLPYGEVPAILLSGIAFGMMHGNFFQFFYAAALGILFGYIYVRTGKYRVTVILHMIINFCSGVVPLLLNQWADYDTYCLLETYEEQSAHINAHIGAFLGLTLYSFLEYGFGIAGLILLICLRKKIQIRQKETDLLKGERAAALVNFGTMAALLLYVLLFIANLLMPVLMQAAASV